MNGGKWMRCKKCEEDQTRCIGKKLFGFKKRGVVEAGAVVYLRRMNSSTTLVTQSSDSASACSNPYETERILREYLLFHYGSAQEVVGYPFAPVDALEYPVRCVRQCVDVSKLGASSRALDLGCAVGRSSFELARWCGEVIGIDYSAAFISAAESVRMSGVLEYQCPVEGELTMPLKAVRPEAVDPQRVRFEQGDAMALRGGLGKFDVVLMANLIDRLREPQRCLASLSALVSSGGQLVITSPYTWMEEYTPRENWLGGKFLGGKPLRTIDGLRECLGADFELLDSMDLPFLIREHARKFQWSVAHGTRWIRRG
jgi:putative 4-mercaptohistidine N1-methyltranferase